MLGFLDLDAGDLKGHELQHGEISKMFNKKKQSICTCFVCNCTSTHCIAWMLKIMVLQSGLINNWICSKDSKNDFIDIKNDLSPKGSYS